jgi:hypothetical protein
MAIELMKYLTERFPALTLDAGLFYRWPVGIRFDLGGRPYPSSQVMSGVLDRATVLYEALFEADDKCVVIAGWVGRRHPTAALYESVRHAGNGLNGTAGNS